MGNKNIRIENIKMNQVGVFKTLDLDFPNIDNDDTKAEIHIFTGANGTGKTTILEGLTSAWEANIDHIYSKTWKTEHNQEILVLNTNDGTEYFTFFKNNELEHSLNLGKTSNYNNWKNISEANQGYSNSNRTGRNDSFITTYALFAYSGYRKLLSSEKTDKIFAFPMPLNQAINFNKDDFDFMIFSNWALNILHKNAHAHKNNNKVLADSTRKTLALIENIISKITQKQFNFDVNYETNLRLVVELNGKIVNINHLPSGLISIFTWLGDLLYRLDGINWKNKNISITEQNFILFLDEIEVHLHPKWQRKVLPLVQKLFPNAQVFVSTHSPFVVNSVSDAWVYKFDLDEEGYSFVSKPEKTSPAKSTSLILNEIFDVEENFGEEVQKELEEFYALRKNFMHSKNGARLEKELQEKASFLLSYDNIELSNIIGFELRQLSRLKNKDLSL